MSYKLINKYNNAVDEMVDLLLNGSEEGMNFEDHFMQEAQGLTWLTYNDEIQAMSDAMAVCGLQALTLMFMGDVMERIA